MELVLEKSNDARIDPHLRSRLEAASEGLVYGSESDYPFTFFAVPGVHGFDSPAEFARLVGAPPELRVRETSWDHFVAWPLSGGDPVDPSSGQTAASFGRLDSELRALLKNLRVIRIGEVQIYCFIVGDDGRGNLGGLMTMAVET